MKKFFKVLKYALIALTLGIGFAFIKALVRAKRFRNSMDIDVDKLDEMAYFKNKYVNYYTQEMRDFKVGAFFGTLTCEMGEMSFSRREYDMTVVAEDGNVILVLPRDVGVLVTTPDSYATVVDDRVSQPERPKTLIAITAYLPMGLLILKNPD